MREVITGGLMQALQPLDVRVSTDVIMGRRTCRPRDRF